MSLIDDIEAQATSAVDSFTTTGAPALAAAAESYAATQLAGQATVNQQAATNALNAAVASSPAATGIMASFETTLQNIGTGVFFKQYGLYIVIGVAAVLLIGRKIL